MAARAGVLQGVRKEAQPGLSRAGVLGSAVCVPQAPLRGQHHSAHPVCLSGLRQSCFFTFAHFVN